MSWEVTRTDTLKCPCGEGTYAVTHRSDDWGRCDETWSMNCPTCHATYQLVTFPGDYKGVISDVRYGWALKVRCAEADHLREQASSAATRAQDLAVARYRQQWLDTLNRTTKKALWRSITADGKRYPSSSTFYMHLKSTTVDLYLMQYFVSNWFVLLQELGIVDPKIEQIRQDASRLEAEANQIVRTASFGGPGDMRKSGPVTPTW